MGSLPNNNLGPGPIPGLFRVALVSVQILLCLAIPVFAGVAEVCGVWRWTPTWERIHYANLATAVICLGFLRLEQLTELINSLSALWRERKGT